MIFLNELMSATNSCVIDGSDYLWKCYGSKPRILDFGKSDDVDSVSCVFETNLQRVLQVKVHDDATQTYMLWVDPDFKDKYLQECVEKNINPLVCYDNVLYEDVNDSNLILSKIREIFSFHDELVDMSFELDNDVIAHLNNMATARNISISQLITETLTQCIKFPVKPLPPQIDVDN